MRVALADDSGIFRDGLRALLEAAEIDVRYAARDGDELLRFMAVEQPDAVILDVRMPPEFTDEGLRVAERVKILYPQVGVLVLSTYGETAYAVRLMSIGASGLGYLLKDRVSDVGCLVDALEQIVAGQPVIDQEIVAKLFAPQMPRSRLDDLAPREREVLRLMAEGRSNLGIGTALNLSDRTIESYIARVFAKLDISSGGPDNGRVLAVLAWLREHRSKPA